MFLQYLTLGFAAVFAVLAPSVVPFVLAFAIGMTLAKLCVGRATMNVIMVLLETAVLGAFTHEGDLYRLFPVLFLGALVPPVSFLYKVWSAGLLPGLIYRRHLQMVIRSTVFAIRDLPPGGKAVFYFYPQVDSFTQDVANLYAALGWVVGLGRIVNGSRSGGQIVMAVQAPLDPIKLKTSLVHLRRVGALRIKAS